MSITIGIILLAIAIAISISKSQNIPKEDSLYIGKSEKEIRDEFGVPNKEYKVGVYKVIEYVSEHGNVLTRGVFSNTKKISKFYFEHGKIVKHEQYSEK